MWFEWSSRATAARTAEATPLAEAYLRLAHEDPSPELRAAGWEVRGVWCWGTGRITEAVENLDRALALVADLPVPTEGFRAEQRMVSMTFGLLTHALHGDVSETDTFAGFDQLADAIPDRFGVASVCGFAASTAIALGNWEQAERFATMGTEANRTGQFSFWVGQALMQLGIVEVWRGAIDKGVADFTTGRETYTGIGGRSALSTFEASIGLTLIGQGRVEEAAPFVADARAEVDRMAEAWNEPVVTLAEAVLAHARGEADLAAERVAAAVSTAREQGSHALAERVESTATELGIPHPR
jgi:hypothetical protein